MLTVTVASSGRVVTGSLSSATVKLALPCASVPRQVVELLAHRRHLIVGEAEGVAGKARRAPWRRRW